MKVHARALRVVAILIGGASLAVCGGGGGYQTPSTPTTPSTPSGQTVTITIRANGTVDPREVNIDMGDAVRFVNEDTRPHEPQSNPHLVHTDCPALNRVGVLQPGQNRTSDPFNDEKACGYHDHMNPDTAGLAGTIRVAGAQGPAGPIYVKH
jgi:plastocyanin